MSGPVSATAVLALNHTTITTVRTSPASRATKSPVPEANTSSNSAMPTGAIAGIVIGVVVLLTVIGVGLFFYIRYRRRNKNLKYGRGSDFASVAPAASYNFAPSGGHKKQGSDVSGLAPLLLNSWKSGYSRHARSASEGGANVSRSKSVASFHSKDVDELSFAISLQQSPPLPVKPSMDIDDPEWGVRTGTHSKAPSTASYYSARGIVVPEPPVSGGYKYQQLDAPAPHPASDPPSRSEWEYYNPSNSLSAQSSPSSGSFSRLPRLEIPSKQQQEVTGTRYHLNRPVALLEPIVSGVTPSTATTNEASTLDSLQTDKLRSALDKFPLPPPAVPAAPPVPRKDAKYETENGAPQRQDTDSSESLYSQWTVADSPVLPQSERPGVLAPEGLMRGNTTMIGQLLKSRAKKGDLARELTTGSHIERQDSIRETQTPQTATAPSASSRIPPPPVPPLPPSAQGQAQGQGIFADDPSPNTMVKTSAFAFWQPGMGVLKKDADVPVEVTASPIDLYTPWDTDPRRDATHWGYQPPGSALAMPEQVPPRPAAFVSPVSPPPAAPPATPPSRSVTPVQSPPLPPAKNRGASPPPVVTGPRQLPRPSTTRPVGPRGKDNSD